VSTTETTFSDDLEHWIETDQEKTLGDLQSVFEERTFAVAILILMAPTALPIPTGGITHVLELMTLLLSLEMVAGRRTIWLPERWRCRPLGAATTEKAIPAVLRFVRRCERFSRRRGAGVLERGWVWRLLGVLLGALTISAALAPPFSGLDTLPGAGVVLICLAILLEDLLFAGVGLLLGAAGTALSITIGAAIARALRDLF
jgi:hypothetical protein